MSFDLVFDVQKAFRKLLQATSYPGDIVSLQEEAQGLAYHWSCYAAMSVLMHVLLDADTSFMVDSMDEQLTMQFHKMTYSNLADRTQAAFLFVSKQHPTPLATLIKEANAGTLEDPHVGATLIVECDAIQPDGELVLSGPGIQDQKSCRIQIDQEWIAARQEKNQMFPIGIDMIFIDALGNVLALPRTTKVERSKSHGICSSSGWTRGD